MKKAAIYDSETGEIQRVIASAAIERGNHTVESGNSWAELSPDADTSGKKIDPSTGELVEKTTSNPSAQEVWDRYSNGKISQDDVLHYLLMGELP